MEKYENFGRVRWTCEVRIDAVVYGSRCLPTVMLMPLVFGDSSSRCFESIVFIIIKVLDTQSLLMNDKGPVYQRKNREKDRVVMGREYVGYLWCICIIRIHRDRRRHETGSPSFQ
jgi:hypothetical protein